MDNEIYSMKSKPHGLCLIINNKTFNSHVTNSNLSQTFSFKEREGSNKDVNELIKTFQRLHFITCLHENLNFNDFNEVLNIYASSSHSKFDCFICFVMSHGHQGYIYTIEGLSISQSHITQRFQSNKCPTLTNKPKLFFFQACQGNNPIEGVQSNNLEQNSVTTSLEADYLIAHSTVPGYLAYRSRLEGSWFITSIIECLNKRVEKDEDIQSILVRVNHQMSDKPLKQMPMTVSTLRKKLIFS